MVCLADIPVLPYAIHMELRVCNRYNGTDVPVYVFIHPVLELH